MKEFLQSLPEGLLEKIKTPVYVLELDKLEENLRVLKKVAEESGAKILLAQKGFSGYAAYGIVKKYLSGSASSGLNEALLAREYFSEGEIHVYSPAFSEGEVERVAEFADTIVFNSETQIDACANAAKEIAKKHSGKILDIGLRVNPEYSEIETPLYDPCSPLSRLGALKSSLSEGVSEKIDMLHFHAMCEQNSDTLERILERFEEKFGNILHKVKRVNFGGGHHITRPDYDIPLLIKTIKNFRKRYSNIEEIYLEPGEAVALNAGVFLSRVLDVCKNSENIAILDCSAPCHMPDVLEMPYRPNVEGAGKKGEKKFDYMLTGRSCLAGDQIGIYSFDSPLSRGDILCFKDMAHYTTVKTTTFNGVNLPDIAHWDAKEKKFSLIKTFGYEEFKSRI